MYRRVPVRIMGAQHEPVQPYLIQPRMEQLMASYAESTEHLVPSAYTPTKTDFAENNNKTIEKASEKQRNMKYYTK